jgi:hypothetical protein
MIDLMLNQTIESAHMDEDGQYLTLMMASGTTHTLHIQAGQEQSRDRLTIKTHIPATQGVCHLDRATQAAMEIF